MHRPLRPLRRDLRSEEARGTQEGFFGVSENPKCTIFMQAQPQMKFHPRAAQDLPLPSDFCGDLLKQGRREGLIKFRKLWPFQTTFANGRSVPLSPLPFPTAGRVEGAHSLRTTYIRTYTCTLHRPRNVPPFRGLQVGHSDSWGCC